MKPLDTWHPEQEYQVGFDHGSTGYPFTLFWKNPSEYQKELNNEYTKGYAAGKEQRFKNLLTRQFP